MFVWTISDAIGVTVAILALLSWAIFAAWNAWVQYRCKHPTFRETRACDAICNQCGKNLGFVGAVRESRAAAKGSR